MATAVRARRSEAARECGGGANDADVSLFFEWLVNGKGFRASVAQGFVEAVSKAAHSTGRDVREVASFANNIGATLGLDSRTSTALESALPALREHLAEAGAPPTGARARRGRTPVAPADDSSAEAPARGRTRAGARGGDRASSEVEEEESAGEEEESAEEESEEEVSEVGGGGGSSARAGNGRPPRAPKRRRVGPSGGGAAGGGRRPPSSHERWSDSGASAGASGGGGDGARGDVRPRVVSRDDVVVDEDKVWLGEGGFGGVFRSAIGGFTCADGTRRTAAIKRMRDKDVEAASMEAAMHALAVHRNVVELLGVCELPSEHEASARGARPGPLRARAADPCVPGVADSRVLRGWERSGQDQGWDVRAIYAATAALDGV